MKLYSFIPSAILLAAATTLGLLHSATVASGGLIKGSLPAVYYVGANNKRYVFPNDKTYFTWYADFSGVTKVTDADLASYPIGGNVTYRPGTRLVKIQSDPKVYAVDAGGTLRWVKTEAAAIALFGGNWNKQIDDLSDSFFVNYIVGADISSAADFTPALAQQAALTINADKKLVTVAPGSNNNANLPVNTPIVPVASACTPNCALGSACVENACQLVPGPSNLTVRAFIIDSSNTCFVGDACTTGACCSVDGNKFADNADLKAVRFADRYLYADKQQLCGRTGVSSTDKVRISQELTDMASAAATQTANKMNVIVNIRDVSGDQSLSRIPGTCNWWVAPDDISSRVAGQVDSSTDTVFVIGSRTYDFGAVSEPDSQTVDQTAGLSGAGYTYVNKEWETNISGAPDHSLFLSAFADQLTSAVGLGITNANASFVGNHCRDGKRDMDETGVDCGGSGCTACPYGY